jgi:hypothetical protein
LITSWPDHSPSGNQKRFWRDLGSEAGNSNTEKWGINFRQRELVD